MTATAKSRRQRRARRCLLAVRRRAAGGLVIALALGACQVGSGDESDSARKTAIAPDATSVHGISLVPELDEQSGAVTLPFDRLTYSTNDAALLLIGQSVAMSQCANKKGVEFVASTWGGDPVYDSESYFGPWTTGQARKFGFVEPAPNADLAANGIKGAPPADSSPDPSINAALTESDWAKIEQCGKDPRIRVLMEAQRHTGPWWDALASARSEFLRSAAAKSLLGELETCFRTHGLTPMKSDPALPQGARVDEINETQISLAVTTVNCKKSVDFTRRMAVLESRSQAPVIAKYAEEMLSQRDAIDKALVQAKELKTSYLADRSAGASAAPHDEG